ncbi:hypothetical protein [Amycolatopsis sp.]|uniref:hypothetical protein n=1 Tax=Amycolatopsis sp. TaxID=37632 RepID=UPI002D7E7AE6|nr:hypothetical protein [Amycolatopsis sp.]HET6711613.1 hypothetical protein [Amycolatopsis sp.]
MRAPRPWTASLQRPAAKILVAGGLTLAGWLLGAALSGGTASAADRPACPEAPVVSTVDHAAKPFWHARHHKSRHETGEAPCAAQPKIGSAEPTPADEPVADEPETAPETTKDSSAAEEPAAATPDSASSAPVTTATSETEAPATAPESPSADEPVATTKKTTTKTTDPDGSEAPKATSGGGNLLGNVVGGTLKAVSGTTTKDTTGEPGAMSSGGDLLGGLLGSVLDVVGSTLTTVTDTVGVVTDTLSHTVLAPLTQPPAGHPEAPVLLPLDDILNPVLGGSSNSGGVTVTVPDVTTLVAPVPATVDGTVPVAVATTAAPQHTTRAAVVHLVVRQARALPAVQDQPRDSDTHATGGGGDSTPGLPGGTTAPSAPAPTAAPGHDGSGGARHAFAVHTDDVTTTQLKLIGTSRDHDVDGAGREAALPTTSPD